MRKIILTVLLLFVFSCGKNPGVAYRATIVNSSIIGGEKVKEENIFSRHTVGLFNHHKKTICTASIIESDLILTAAHCVEDAPAEKVEIIFGSSISGNTGISYRAKATFVHKEYVNTKEIVDNDVALIRLKKSVPAPYRALDLEEGRSLLLLAGEKIMALGYGMARTGLFTGKGVLRMAEVTLKNYETNGKLVIVDQRQGAGVCFGDSGGPSFTLVNGRPVLVGVTSFVSVPDENKKADCKDFSALSNPNYFYDWIQESKQKI